MRYVVYEAIGADATVLYVGATKDLYNRLEIHKYASPWFKVAAYLRVRRFATADEAADAETRLIAAHRPPYNRQRTHGGFVDIEPSRPLSTAPITCIEVRETTAPLPPAPVRHTGPRQPGETQRAYWTRKQRESRERRKLAAQTP